eukprot:3274500-Amphidinium_carterae.1
MTHVRRDQEPIQLSYLRPWTGEAMQGQARQAHQGVSSGQHHSIRSRAPEGQQTEKESQRASELSAEQEEQRNSRKLEKPLCA